MTWLSLLFAIPVHADLSPLPTMTQEATDKNFRDAAEELRRVDLRAGGSVSSGTLTLSSAVTVTGTLTLSGATLAGGALLRQYVSSVSFLNSNPSSGVLFPGDNTIPQVTEGYQVFVATITPLNASSILLTRAIVNYNLHTGGATMGAICLFKNYAANALACSILNLEGGSPDGVSVLEYQEAASDTAQRNFSIRIGGDVDNSVGIGRSGLYGNVVHHVLTIMEIAQ